MLNFFKILTVWLLLYDEAYKRILFLFQVVMFLGTIGYSDPSAELVSMATMTHGVVSE